VQSAAQALGASLHVVTSTEFNPYLVYTPSEQKMDKQAFLAYVSPVHYNTFEKAHGEALAAPPVPQAATRAGKRRRATSVGGGGVSSKRARARPS